MAVRPVGIAVALVAAQFAAGCVTEGGDSDNSAVEAQIRERIASFATLRGSSFEENVQVLGGLLKGHAVPMLVEALGSSRNERVRAGCALALADALDPAAVEPLVAAATRDSVPGMRYTAAYCLCRFRDPRGLPVLFEALRSSNESDRFIGIFRLREVTGMDYGYKETDPPESRAQAIQRWETWFREAGTQGAAMKLMPSGGKEQ
jgi:HEAT repeat protein